MPLNDYAVFRFIVDAVTQGECVPGGRRKVAAAREVDGSAAPGGDVGGLQDKASAAVPSVSSAPLTSGEKDLLRHGRHKPFIGFWQPRKAGLNKHT